MNKRYFDLESRSFVSLENLRAVFDSLVAEGEYYPEEFPGFVGNCTDKNGTLIAIPDEMTDRVLYREYRTGRIVNRSRRDEILRVRGVDLSDLEEIEYNHFETISEE